MYDEAMRYYNEALELKRKTLPANDPAIGDTLNNIGDLFADQDKFEEALKYYDMSIKIYRLFLFNSKYNVIIILYGIYLIYKFWYTQGNVVTKGPINC
jgi:tetratricopeptide (TPR) repeat protein